jgi:glycosyltransferase involved in cell wall biosynthesis
VTHDDRLRVAFLIRSLHRGGAERQLALLAAGLDPAVFQVGVITFYPGGAVWDELAVQPKVTLVSLDKRGRWQNLATVRRLTAILEDWRPAVLHCYMVEPSLVGLLAGRRASVPAIVWGVRSSNVDYLKYGWFNWGTFRLAAALSRRPNLIIANTDAGRAFHIAHGYPADRVRTIPNGIDTDRFHPSSAARAPWRERWGLSEDDVAVGVVARLDPMKGHEVLLRAVARLKTRLTRLRVICVGGGAPAYRSRLTAQAAQLGLDREVVWAGELDRLESVYPAFEIACSSSVFGEGFSNAVAEAMACQLPCVVTDVGDSAAIVGDTGLVTPPSDPDRLAEALLNLADRSPADRLRLGARARARIIGAYSLHAMIQRTAAAYRELEERSRDPRRMAAAVSDGGSTT